MLAQFGSGVIYGVPTAGNLAANPTPYRFGVVQEASLDLKASLKSLFGQQQLSLATARGKVEVSGKAKLAVFDVNMINQMFLGLTSTAGTTRVFDQEAHIAGASVTVNNLASPVTPITDYGVQNGVTGQQMTLVTGTPAANQYSVVVATGVYTFSAADIAANLPVLISYSAKLPGGSTIAITSQLMGYAPEIQMMLYNQFRGKLFAVQLNCVTVGNVSFATKLEDFWTLDIDYAANVDNANTLGYLYGDAY